MKKVLLFILLPFLSMAQTQIGLDIEGEAIGDLSGSSVSLSNDGTTVAIGAPNNNGSGTDSGSVRVYKNVSGTWTKIGADINGEAADDRSGSSVSISSDGTIVAIGAPYNDGGGTNAGSVRVYQNVSGTWTQIGADINGETTLDLSGRSVSLSKNGTFVAIGAPYNGGSGTNAGSVRVYRNISGTWTKIGADINGEAANDQSGYRISLSDNGTTVAIGGASNDGSATNAGSVRVYQNISETWTQLGGDIDGEAAGDLSGSSVSLSSDGTTVAIGAINNDGNGTNAGSVRVYRNISGTWIKIGTDIDGEASNDESGYSVSLSGDGATVAIGARNNDGNGADAGHVRVYDLTAVLSSDSFVLRNFSVYPNPTSEQVTITLQENLQLEKVNIYNTLGQLIKTEKSNSINVSTLSKGSYYFEVITNQGKATKTVLVQ
jgi:Flp pilus assembly pilin Flp